MVANTVLPASISIANIPALNFWTTFPMTSIASSFGKRFLYVRALDYLPAIRSALTAISRAVPLRTGFVDV